jgi:hypothetical protein
VLPWAYEDYEIPCDFILASDVVGLNALHSNAVTSKWVGQSVLRSNSMLPGWTGSHWANAAPKKCRQTTPEGFLLGTPLPLGTQAWDTPYDWQTGSVVQLRVPVATRSLVSISIHSHPSTDRGSVSYVQYYLISFIDQSTAGIIVVQPRELPPPLTGHAILEHLKFAHACSTRSDRMRSNSQRPALRPQPSDEA